MDITRLFFRNFLRYQNGIRAELERHLWKAPVKLSIILVLFSKQSTALTAKKNDTNEVDNFHLVFETV